MPGPEAFSASDGVPAGSSGEGGCIAEDHPQAGLEPTEGCHARGCASSQTKDTGTAGSGGARGRTRRGTNLGAFMVPALGGGQCHRPESVRGRRPGRVPREASRARRPLLHVARLGASPPG